LHVLVLDDDDDLCETMAEFIRDAASSATAVHQVDELVGLGARVGTFDLAILDINLGPSRPSGLDAYRWLVRTSFRGKVVFLTGHARSNRLVAEAIRSGVEVLQKPLDACQLRALLARPP
jgi:DNA-binding NtrC family response regulator